MLNTESTFPQIHVRFLKYSRCGGNTNLVFIVRILRGDDDRSPSGFVKFSTASSLLQWLCEANLYPTFFIMKEQHDSYESVLSKLLNAMLKVQ